MSKLTWYTVFLFIFLPFFLNGQNSAHYWLDKAEVEINPAGNRVIIPNVYRTIESDTISLKNIIAQAPHETEVAAKNSNTILTVPMPDGTSEDFRIVLYDMMESDLSAEYPVIKTGYGISTGKDLASIRFDWTYRGFHAFIRTADHTVFIDPYSFDDKVHYVSYYKKDYPAPEAPFTCHLETPSTGTDIFQPVEKSGDCVFRSYRLAIATTGQYSNYHGASNSSQSSLVLSAVTTTMNRVNGVYEQDVTIRMVLIANTTNVFYYNGSTDPYSNNNAGAMLNENQTTLNNVIGSANYDIGHVFGTGGGGVAWLGVPCTSNKAKGVTGSSNPVGDPFDIDYVAHEMGHQWGANHTQNNNCNRNNSTAMEPGSASTIMGYAGICSPNIQSNSDAYFHGVSIQEMNNYIVNSNGNNCDVPIAGFSNSAPTVSAGSNYTIPASTPFVLTAVGSDPDLDPITYCWEQWDNEVNNTMPPTAFNTQGPVFRSFFATSSPQRYFPNLNDLVNNVTPTWEVLPAVSRNMEFRVTARDFNGTAGCTDEDNMIVMVNSGAGPFAVTDPNLPTTWTEGQSETVTWDVAGTTNAPVSCANVDILLSYDGGFTYPVTLASGVPNSGSANVTVPIGTSITARVMVICSDNIFFDISNNNFTIDQASFPDYTMSVSPTERTACGDENAVFSIDVGSLLGYSSPVSLSVSGLPFGVATSFSSNPVTPGNSSTLTISNLNFVPGGTYTLTIQASSATGMKSVNVDLTVLPVPQSITLQLPADNGVDVNLMPTLTWQTDINANLYHVQVATDIGFTNLIVNTTTMSTFLNVDTELLPNTKYYWRVRGYNQSCDGPWATTRIFNTLPCTSFFSGTDVVIPSFGAVDAMLNISHTGDATDINVNNISGTHSFVGDLTFLLIAPDNTQVTLLSNECGGDDNFNFGFDDQSSLTNIPCPPTTGQIFQPVGNLSDFAGSQINGTWRLRIDDNASGDGGMLDEWEIRICAINSTLLPVELISFDAKALDRSIILNWSTALEIDNAGFEIERKAETENEFKTIGWVEGKGNNSLETSYYDFEDKNVAPGIIYYYRLRQLDFDGKETYSEIRSATLQESGEGFLIFPNPVTEMLNVHCLKDISENIPVSVTDIQGRVVLATEMQDCQMSLDLSSLASGVYILKIANQQHRVIKD
ncbi:MAG: T9SS C-terminal target domain-containing protein [Bacteroidetes bacterium]|nr:MAG: T9SS C-terminal target domain-containing protein [Bacteroidota bacterium]